MIIRTLKHSLCVVALIISAEQAGAQTTPVFTNYQPPINATVSTSYSFTYAATGSPQPTFTVASGSLPPGITLSSAGLLSGTPTSTAVTSGSTVTAYTGTISASNGVGTAPTQAFTIIVGTSLTTNSINWQVFNYYFAGGTSPTLPGRLYVPSGYTPTKSYPVVIFYHGDGEAGTGNTKQVNSNISGLCAAAQSNQFFLYCPEESVGWNVAEPTNSLRMVAQLQLMYNIDSSKIWVTGLSLGGEGVWYDLEIFTAAITGGVTASGEGPAGQFDTASPAIYFPPLVNKPIWCHVNNQDPTVYPGNSWGRVNYIQQYSGISPVTPFAANYTNSGAPYYSNGTSFWAFNNNTLQLTQYVSNSHDSWHATFGESQLYTWMLSFSNPISQSTLQVGKTMLFSLGELQITGNDSQGQAWNSVPWGAYNTTGTTFPFASQTTGPATAVSLNLMTRFSYYFLNNTTNPAPTPYSTATINGTANTQIGNQGWTTMQNTESDFILHGLMPGGKYKLSFYGNYNVDTYTHTNWTRYKATAGSQSQYADLNVYNNTTNKAVIDGMIADSTGAIAIGVLPSPGLGGQVGALNVLEVTRESSGVVTVSDFRTAAGLPSDGSQDTATPAHDGVPNLMKYAFNMTSGNYTDLSTFNHQYLTANGTSGLPLVQINNLNQLTITFVRRIATNNPGITYVPQVSSDLTGAWTTLATTPAVTNIDTTWERVTYTDTVSSGNRFIRVRITEP